MSEWLDKILAAKLQHRKELARLPFDKKLDLMEKIRERSRMLAESPLRKKTEMAAPAMTLPEIEVAVPEANARKKALTPPVARQRPQKRNRKF